MSASRFIGKRFIAKPAPDGHFEWYFRNGEANGFRLPALRPH